MGGIGLFVGGMFFLLLCFAALTSTIALLEIPVTFLVDEKGFSRKWTVIGIAVLVFIIGIPSMLSQGAVDGLTNFMFYEGKPKAVFDVVFDVFSEIGLPMGGFLMTLFISIRWKLVNFNKEISIGNDKYLGSFLNKYIDLTIRFFGPLILGTMFVAAVLQKFFGITLF
jgi:NSS family neurotransmitter:Na+ symporter